MAISDRLMSIANMTKGAMSDKDKSMSTRSPDGSTMDRLVKSTSDMIKGIPSDFDVQQILKNLPKTSDGSVKAREVEVAGEFEDQLMKMYDEAVEGGYKGSFFDFLIDRIDPEFDPASPMRVSRLAEEMKGIPSAMDMKMLRKMITG